MKDKATNKTSLVNNSRLLNERGFSQWFGNLIIQWEAILVLMFVFEVILFANLSPYFLDYFNLMNATFTFMEKAILALPMIFVIMAGDIDISVASIIALCSFAMGYFASIGVGAAGLVVIGLAVGLAAGAFNGFFITRFGMPAIAVTLASSSLFRGIAQAALEDQAYTKYPEGFAYFGQGYVGNSLVPFELLVFIVLVAVIGFVLHKSTYGRKLYAIGNSESAARFSGIRVNRIRMINFMLNGMFAGISAILLTSRIGSTRPNIALGFELEAIMLVVLGGVSINGGKGNIFGVVLVVFFIGYLKFGMGLMMLSAKVMIITTGLLLVIAVLLPGILDSIKGRRKLARQQSEDLLGV